MKLSFYMGLIYWYVLERIENCSTAWLIFLNKFLFSSPPPPKEILDPVKTAGLTTLDNKVLCLCTEEVQHRPRQGTLSFAVL